MNIIKKNPRISSEEVKQQLPLPLEIQKNIAQHRKELTEIIQGRSIKKIVIVGPCSADFKDSVLDYAHRLKHLQEKISDSIKIVMRTYTAKPRTTIGRKGIEHTGEFGSNATPNEALHFARGLLLQIATLGVPIASELLYPENVPFIDDLVSYGALGSRSSLDQGHREVASGMSFPIGVKNPLGADYKGCMDSLEAINHPHQHITYDGHHCDTKGHHNAHIVLRGNNHNGISHKNYGPDIIHVLKNNLIQRGLNHRIVVDLNHDNSGKNGLLQPANLQELLRQNDNDIVGIMIESYLHDGKQSDNLPFADIVHGTSLTDSCLGRDKTEQMILDLHKKLRFTEKKNYTEPL